MLGQAFFQILVTFLLLFQGPGWFEINAGHLEEKKGINSVHYTIIFNTFVWMQLFNEVNSRNLNGEGKAIIYPLLLFLMYFLLLTDFSMNVLFQ